MTYQIREIFYTLQGEGFHTGRPSVFCRFSGCNLWSGRESDRSNSVCRFCDTDFIGTNGENGGKYNDCNTLVEKILRVWGAETALASPFVVLTGGEPLLQVDDNLVACMHEHGCVIAVETNGTISPTAGIDWICCSPKFGAPLIHKSGWSLKP
jgi:7-carboxy-7-deazaguanine synthase (Cx14CxxC type)